MTLEDEIRGRMREGDGDCELWVGSFEKKLPMIVIGDRPHRVKVPVRLWLLGDARKPHLVPAASCGDYRCVARAHLVQLTHSEKMKLHVKALSPLHKHKIRVAKRKRAPKLTEAKVAQIRAQRLQGVPRHVVAAEAGVTAKMVYLIDVGKAWARVSVFGP